MMIWNVFILKVGKWLNRKEIKKMNETYKFLKENTQVNYVSTINAGKPSCRPFGDPIMVDNKIYVMMMKNG